MDAKRKSAARDKAGKSPRKTHPEQVSGISAAAIEGASESSVGATENAEKMARPGPGLDVGRQMHRGSPPNEESHAPESGTERDIETDRAKREISRDEI